MTHALAYKIASLLAGVFLLWRAPAIYIAGFLFFLGVNYYGWQKSRALAAERGPGAMHVAMERMLSHAPVEESAESYLAEIDSLWYAVVWPAFSWIGGVIWMGIVIAGMLRSRARYRQITRVYEETSAIHTQINSVIEKIEKKMPASCLQCTPDAEARGLTLRARRLFLKASVLHERAAILTPVKTSEGQRSRIDAVLSALDANMFLRADRLAARFAHEKDTPPGLVLAIEQILAADVGTEGPAPRPGPGPHPSPNPWMR